MKFAFVLLIVFSASEIPDAFADGIVADGSTNTHVVTNPQGRQTVEVAPPDLSRTSLNRFSDFDVSTAGAALNNQTAHAATIISEVTSSRLTRLEGPIEVVGPAANLVIANPNGIVANGVQFLNAPAVALTTAPVGFSASGRPQLNVESGRLEVGQAGLSGVMAELDLLARRIQINGPVRLDGSASAAAVNIVAGKSTTLIGGSGGQPGGFAFADVTEAGATDAGVLTDAIAVDITSGASMRSGAIRLHVTDAGAGVRIAGDAIAATDLRIDTNGQVHLSDAQLKAQGAVAITADTIAVTSQAKRSQIESAASGVTLKAKNGIAISGGAVRGVDRDNGELASLGGVTLAAGRGALSLTKSGSFATQMDASAGGVALAAGRDVVSQGSTIRSGADIQISSVGTIGSEGDLFTATRSIRMLSTGETRLSQSRLNAQTDISIDSGSVSLLSSPDARTEVVSATGAVRFTAREGAIQNSGSLVEGRRASLSDPDAAAAVTLSAATDVVNTSIAADRLGVIFGRNGDVVIEAGGNIENLTARLFSNAGIKLSAGDRITNRTELAGNTGITAGRARGKRSWRSLWFKPAIERRRAAFGMPSIDGEQALITAVGDVAMNAARIHQGGGQINGNTVALHARNSVTIESAPLGSLQFAQACGIIGCRSTGSSVTAILPARIVAARTLTLASDGQVRMVASRAIGYDGIAINARSLQAESLMLPHVAMRRSGLSAFFQGSYGWLGQTWDGGFLSAPDGAIKVASLEPSSLAGTETFARDSVTLGPSGTMTKTPQVTLSFRRPIGLIAGGSLR